MNDSANDQPLAVSSLTIFGPVPSRRLGQSLGIGNVPPKTCSYSCVYCQVGPTPAREIAPREFWAPAEIVVAVGATSTRCATMASVSTISPSCRAASWRWIAPSVRRSTRVVSRAPLKTTDPGRSRPVHGRPASGRARQAAAVTMMRRNAIATGETEWGSPAAGLNGMRSCHLMVLLVRRCQNRILECIRV